MARLRPCNSRRRRCRRVAGATGAIPLESTGVAAAYEQYQTHHRPPCGRASAEPGRAARSGEKYQTPQGFTAIKDGIKAHADAIQRLRTPRGGGKPRWLRAQMASGEGYDFVRRTVREHRLATVCEEAKCPNIGECWNAGTATSC